MTDLDDAYANSAHIPGGSDYPARWAAASAAFRALHPARRLTYGPGLRHWVDLVAPEAAARGLLVIVHGGYWLRFSPDDFAHLAAGALASGWAVALPCYDLCPAQRISHITRQVAQAVTAAQQVASGPIHLTGHSAGGHLVARMLAPGVLPAPVLARVARVVPVSPLADLRPLLRTSMNADLRLDAAEASAESPVLQPRPGAAVHVWVGGAERPAFLDQARWLANAWSCPLTIDTGRHHFDVIEGLEAPSALLSAVIG